MRILFAFGVACVVVGCQEAAPPPRRVEVPSTKLPNGAFDRGSAAASIGAVDYRRCLDPDGPTGAGHITFTFEPDGSVSMVNVDGGPFSGTRTEECLVRLGLAVRVRPFDVLGGHARVLDQHGADSTEKMIDGARAMLAARALMIPSSRS